MKNRLTSLLTLTILAFAAPLIGRAQVVSTLSSEYFTNGYLQGGFIWGQTFQTPDGVAAALDQFTVRVMGPSGMSFSAFIYEWTDGTFDAFNSPAALKWSSAPEGIIGDTDNLVRFETGHLALDAATSYAFWIASNTASLDVSLTYASAYSLGGAMVWVNAWGSGENYADLYDLHFEATFSALSISPVPEPATYATIGLALCGVLALVVRRRRGLPAAPAPAA